MVDGQQTFCDSEACQLHGTAVCLMCGSIDDILACRSIAGRCIFNAGAEDKRMAWYDMDLSTKPYRAMKYHNAVVRGVAFHRSYPLFASSSDDGSAHVFHGMVYQVLQAPPPLPHHHHHHNTHTQCGLSPRKNLHVIQSGC